MILRVECAWCDLLASVDPAVRSNGAFAECYKRHASCTSSACAAQNYTPPLQRACKSPLNKTCAWQEQKVFKFKTKSKEYTN
jgi:hypothetical protein